jgi:hypothetical protein
MSLSFGVKVDRHNAKEAMQIFSEKNNFYEKSIVGFKKRKHIIFFCEDIGKQVYSPSIVGKKNTPSVFYRFF